jgi:HlyD family secretion protein
MKNPFANVFRLQKQAMRSHSTRLSLCRSHSLTILLPFFFVACSAGPATDQAPTEIVKARQWQETLTVQGEIKTAAKTTLGVPGEGWYDKELKSMVADGSFVKKGQVIAQFDAPQSRIELSQAQTELMRKAIAEVGILAMANINRFQLDADTSKVNADLDLSQNYANVDLKIFAQNKILDILIDVGYLKEKKQYLHWKNKQIGARTSAEQAVLTSQREGVSKDIRQHQKGLDSLEIVAPHDGVFLLAKRWDGTVPQIGARLWAGDDFGSLPDLEKQIASFSVPEGQAFGLKEGLAVKVRLAGTGTELELKVTKVGKNASTKSRESPVKYSDFEASIDVETVRRLGLTPSQSISGEVTLLRQEKAITVPNIALIQEAKDYFVLLDEGKEGKRVKVELGVRGPIRSEVKTGLSEGMAVRLVPEQKDEKNDKNDKKTGTKNEEKKGVKV